MMLTSREPDRSWGIYFFSPTLSSAEGSRPNWLLGESECLVVFLTVMNTTLPSSYCDSLTPRFGLG